MLSAGSGSMSSRLAILLVAVTSLSLITATAHAYSLWFLMYLSLALAATTVLLAPGLLAPRFDFLEPLNLAAASVFMSLAVRSFYTLDSGELNNNFFLYGLHPSLLYLAIPALSIGFLFVSFGYYVTRRNIFLPLSINRKLMERRLDERKLITLVLGCVAVSIVCIVLFVRIYNIDLSADIAALSRKRGVDRDGQVSSAGYVRALAQITKYPFLMLVCLMAMGAMKVRKLYVGLAALCGVLAITVPYLSSSRSSFVLVFLPIGFFLYYFGKLNYRHVVVGLVALVMIIFLMGQLRSLNQVGFARYSGPLDSVLSSGNGVDVYRTAAIISISDSDNIRLNGSSYLSLLTAAIPRSWWPDKPQTNLGQWVRSSLFGYRTTTSGMPPGIIGEAYLNFKLFGVAVVSFIFGSLLKQWYMAFRPYLGASALVTMVYAASAWRIGFSSIGASLTQVVVQVLMIIIPFYIMLLYVSRPRARRRRPVSVESTTRTVGNRGKALARNY